MIRKLTMLLAAIATVWILTWAFMHIIVFALILWPFSPYITCAILYLAGWAALRLILYAVD